MTPKQLELLENWRGRSLFESLKALIEQDYETTPKRGKEIWDCINTLLKTALEDQEAKTKAECAEIFRENIWTVECEKDVEDIEKQILSPNQDQNAN